LDIDLCPAYDETATKLDKLRILPNKPNPFFTGAKNTARYLRVLKECNLNNWEIEKVPQSRKREQ
jgi:hypothetical protein